MTEPTIRPVWNDASTYVWNVDRGRLWFEAIDNDGPSQWSADAYFLTAEDRDAFLALFPRSAGLRGSTLSGVPEGILYTARANGQLRSTKVTGALNETGIARYRKLLTVARKVATTGWNVNHANAYPTREAFEKAL